MQKYYLIFAALYFSTCIHAAAEPERNLGLMTYEEYADIKHERPYLFSCEKNEQHIYYFGTNHSRDRYDKQFPILEDFWQKFISATDGKNCAVPVEGALRAMLPTKEECSDYVEQTV
jgi:hypothetical protein